MEKHKSKDFTQKQVNAYLYSKAKELKEKVT